MASAAAVRNAPEASARFDMKALLGKILDVFDAKRACSRVMCRREHYVGWVKRERLSPQIKAPTHKVSAPWIFADALADLKSSVNTLPASAQGSP